MKIFGIILVIGTLVFLTKIIFFQNKTQSMNTIRYVAIGDSYTIGEGVREEESYPSLLTNHLQNEGIDIELVANPAVSGWTTQDAIDRELPIFEQAEPTFATLLIGANDHFMGLDEATFRQRFILLLDRMLAVLPSKKNLIVLTIPDYSVSPQAEQLTDLPSLSESIFRYNDIIKDEAGKRKLVVVDLFPLTHKMKGKREFFVSDGLHPSALQYERWEKLIYPEALKLLK